MKTEIDFTKNNVYLDYLARAIDNVDEKYFDVPRVKKVGDDLIIDPEDSISYERRFVFAVSENYGKIMDKHKGSDFVDVFRDHEVVKSYAYGHKPDPEVTRGYNNLVRYGIDVTTKDMTQTSPDFFIHKSQDDDKEENQKLIVEAKTYYDLKKKELIKDIFKLNVYAEHFNYQNCVLLVVNSSTVQIKDLFVEYLENKFYLCSQKKQERIYVFVKPGYGLDIETLNLPAIRKEYQMYR